MSSTPPTRPQFTPGNRPRGNWSFKGFVVKSVWFVAIAIAVFYLMNTKKEPQATAVTPNAQAPPETLPRPAGLSPSPTPPSQESFENVELTTATSIQRQQLTAAKFKQRQLIATYDEVTRAFGDWEKELAAWEKGAPTLPKSDEGKKLATDTKLVKHYRVVMSQERPTREELGTARALADGLVSPVREAVNNSDDASIPPEELATNLRELRTNACKARDELRAAREQIETLVAQAGDAPSDETLEAAIRRQVHEEADKRTALIEAAVKKAEDEGNQRVAEEKAKAVRVALELEAGRIRDESEQRKAEAARLAEARRAAEAEKAEQARMALLRQKARSPEIKQLLAPLLAKGYTQPRSGGSFDNIGELQPMSLQALRGTGCLEKGDHGMHIMLRIMSDTHSMNDRKVLWTHSYSGTWYDQMRDDVIAAQQAIRQLGPALVAEGLLSP